MMRRGESFHDAYGRGHSWNWFGRVPVYQRA